MKKVNDNAIYHDEPVFCGRSYYVKYTPSWDRRRRVVGIMQDRYYSNDNGHFIDRGCDAYGIRNEVYELTQEEWKDAVKKFAHFDWI